MAGESAAGQVKVRIQTVTPKLADQLLERNTHNRGVTAARIEQYAADMRKGDWQLNGEAIKISADGQILDGQHRLWAILEADVAIETLLITGLPAETQETMDQGRARTFADVLKLRGESNYATLAAAVRIVCVYERDGIPFVNFRKFAPTVKQLSRTLERNPEIRASVKLANGLRRPWVGVSTAAALHYLFSIASPDDAADFMHKLATGENMGAGDPPYVLRERLIKEHYDEGGLRDRVKLAFIVKAWNAYRCGERLNRLVWTPGGSSPDRFPEIDGLAQRELDTEAPRPPAPRAAPRQPEISAPPPAPGERPLGAVIADLAG